MIVRNLRRVVGRFEKPGSLRVCRRGNWFKRGESYKLDTRKWSTRIVENWNTQIGSIEIKNIDCKNSNDGLFGNSSIRMSGDSTISISYHLTTRKLELCSIAWKLLCLNLWKFQSFNISTNLTIFKSCDARTFSGLNMQKFGNLLKYLKGKLKDTLVRTPLSEILRAVTRLVASSSLVFEENSRVAHTTSSNRSINQDTYRCLDL